MTKGSWWSNKHRKYKYQDKKAGLEYNLTLDQAKALMSLPCFYCCRPEPKGLDRISNDFGHTTSNVVPCCGTCNLMLASTPWAAKIEMRESLRSIREKGLLGSWKPPYLTEPAKVVQHPLENEDATESPTRARNGLCFWPHPDEMLPVEPEEEFDIRDVIDAETLAILNAEIPEQEKKQRAEMGRKLREQLENNSRRVLPNPPPRYDEVYYEGVAMLNSENTESSTPILTSEQVKALLEEGRECAKDLWKRLEKMHEITPEMRNSYAKSSGAERFHKEMLSTSKGDVFSCILEELKNKGPISPRELETSNLTPYSQKEVRIAMQTLIENKKIEIDKNLKLIVCDSPIDPEGIQTC